MSLFTGTCVAGLPIAEPVYRDVQRRFTSEEGLPQNSITAIVQGRDGYLWLGTFSGLTRFDGSRFTVLRSLRDQGPSSDRIISLVEDDAGRIWIGTEYAGINVLEDGIVERLPTCSASCHVSALFHWNGTVYALTSDGLIVFDGNLRSRVIAEPMTWTQSAMTSDGALWFGGPAGLFKLEDGRVDAVPTPLQSGESQITLIAWQAGELWLGLTDDLYRRSSTGEWIPYTADRRWPSMTRMQVDMQGRLWLSDEAGRLFKETGASSRLEATGIELGMVLSHLLDREGNLWFGSNGLGLLRLRPARIALLNDPALGLDRPGMPIAGDRQGGVWLGLVCDGLRHRDPQGRVRSWPRLDALDSLCPWSLYPELGGGLWIGTADGRLGYLPDPDASIHTIARWPDNVIVRAIHPAPDGGLWVATNREVRTLRRRADGTFHEGEPLAAMDNVTINHIKEAMAGGHWFIGDAGALRMQDGRIVERWGAEEGLPSRFARALFQTDDGVLWIGSYGGGLLRVEDGRPRHFSEADGLFDDVVSCIMADHEGRLWLSGNRGISMLTREAQERARAGERMEAIGYASNDGLIPAETNGGTQPVCHRDAQGKLWFPLLSGFAVVDPAVATQGEDVPITPMIEEVKVAGSPLPVTGKIRLAANARNLEIGFSAATLTAPEKTRFRFRLGSADPWTDAGSQRSVLYPQPPWGDHVFEVSVRNGASPWSDPPVRLQLSRPLPWHRHPASWMLMCLIAVLLFAGGRRLLLAYLAYRTAKASRDIQQRAAALEVDNLRLAQEAKIDALTGIANYRYFADRLNAIWQTRARERQPVSLLLIDVDAFKSYNDHAGHLAGDECLRRVAQAMQGEVREADLLARYGGEEFVVLMPGAQLNEAATLAERLRATVAALGIRRFEGEDHATVTVSIGCATQPPDARGEQAQLIARADRAMYRAKQGGRNRVEMEAGPIPPS